MPGAKSIARVISDGQRLLAAVAQEAEQLQSAEGQRVMLETVLNQFKDLINRRDGLTAEKQVLSSELVATKPKVVDATINLKAIVRGTLGSRTEKLRQFQIAPRRKVEVTDPKVRKAASAKRAKQKQSGEPDVSGPTVPAAETQG